MAEPLTINVTRAATPAPAVYTVPGSAEIEALSAFARFDGTGAATSFRPALTFYSAAGLILARVFPGDAVVAGDTADVTFAPFLSSGEDTANVPLPTLRAYTTVAANVAIASTVQAVPTDIVACPSVVFTGLETVEIIASIEYDVDMRGQPVAGSGGALIIDLWDTGTNLGTIMDVSVSGIYLATTNTRSVRVTPTAGSHTFSIKGWKSHGAGVAFPTCNVYKIPTGSSSGVGSSLAIEG